MKKHLTFLAIGAALLASACSSGQKAEGSDTSVVDSSVNRIDSTPAMKDSTVQDSLKKHSGMNDSTSNAPRISH